MYVMVAAGGRIRSHKVGIFGGEKHPFFPLLASPFLLLDHMLYGPAHQAGSSGHQNPERSSVITLEAHLERERTKKGFMEERHHFVALDSRASI